MERKPTKEIYDAMLAALPPMGGIKLDAQEAPTEAEELLTQLCTIMSETENRWFWSAERIATLQKILEGLHAAPVPKLTEAQKKAYIEACTLFGLPATLTLR